MYPLSASNLLNIWERGLGKIPVEQALVILGSVFPEATWDALTQLSVTQRDVTLFHLRELTFGSQLKGLADCPSCRERLELAFDADELRSMHLLPDLDLSLPSASQAVISFHVEDYEIGFRLPTSADLMKSATLVNIGQAQQYLLEACIVSTRHLEQTVPTNDLPPNITQLVIQQIGQAAGLANLTTAVTCPSCGHQWEIVFDIVSYFWSEINAWAIHIMREIHILASTYGWREADILAMNARRRQRYLELIGV